MRDLHQRLAALGIAIPEIMLPRPGTDLQKWAIIACDQFTQDRTFWDQVERFVGEAPSTLNMIFPELYIGDPEGDTRLQNIHKTMNTYIRDGVFAPPRKGLVYVERSTPYHQCRRGLVLAVDLEQYDWKRNTPLSIRATEGTVEERIPLRMRVRRGAALENSHVLLLIDDEEDSLLPGLRERAKTASPLYHTPLNQGGAISGWFLNQEEDCVYLVEGLEALAQKAIVRYGDPPFLYAVGDGNHSLASAKAVWEEYKTLHEGDPGLMNHPGRYALVEVENLYDPGIGFEPIHRLLLGTNIAEVRGVLSKLSGFSSYPVESPEKLNTLVEEEGVTRTRFGLITGTGWILIESDMQGFVTDSLQPLLDAFVISQGYGIDYIHGKDALYRRVQDPENPGVGILLPPIKKEGLFKTIAEGGPLPRKSFSMGEAEEKRFYLECRKLF